MYLRRTLAARFLTARQWVALLFLLAEFVLLVEFVLLGEQILWIAGALARGRHMIELWHKWYGTLASVEALAAVVVIAVVSAGILTLIESQRHRTKH